MTYIWKDTCTKRQKDIDKKNLTSLEPRSICEWKEIYNHVGNFVVFRPSISRFTHPRSAIDGLISRSP
jgi:hypothetical protein